MNPSTRTLKLIPSILTFDVDLAHSSGLWLRADYHRARHFLADTLRNLALGPALISLAINRRLRHILAGTLEDLVLGPAAIILAINITFCIGEECPY